jgi:hypothetical protein
VIGHHLDAHGLCGDLWHPANLFAGLGRVAEQGFELGGAEVARIDSHHAIAPLEAHHHMALSAQVVDLAGLHLLQDAREV